MKTKLAILVALIAISISSHADDKISKFADGECLPKNAYSLLDKIDNITCTKNANDSVVVSINGKEGLMSKQGEWLVKPEYDYILSEFQQGLTVVKNSNDKYGFIDESGKVVIPFKYADAWNFTDQMGLAQVKLNKNDKWGFINSKGETVIEPKYDFVYALISENLFTAYRDGKAGFLDKTGKEVIAFEYDEALPFIGGRAMVVKDDKYGFINTKGQIIVPLIYDYASNFENGLATVQLDDKVFTIDTSGKIVQ